MTMSRPACFKRQRRAKSIQRSHETTCKQGLHENCLLSGVSFHIAENSQRRAICYFFIKISKNGYSFMNTPSKNQISVAHHVWSLKSNLAVISKKKRTLHYIHSNRERVKPIKDMVFPEHLFTKFKH